MIDRETCTVNVTGSVRTRWISETTWFADPHHDDTFVWSRDPKPLPKSWRWYDRYRSWDEYRAPGAPAWMPSRGRRCNARRDIIQRRHEKRRRWLERIHEGRATI